MERTETSNRDYRYGPARGCAIPGPRGRGSEVSRGQWPGLGRATENPIPKLRQSLTKYGSFSKSPGNHGSAWHTGRLGFSRPRPVRPSPHGKAGQVVQPQTPSGPHTRSSVATQVTASQAPEDDPLAQAKRALLQPKFDIRKLHNDGDPKAEI
jgi:hypothetical protein